MSQISPIMKFLASLLNTQQQ